MPMMPKRIDPNQLKVKYVLGNWASLPNYPDAEDLLYEAIRDYCAWANERMRITDVSLVKRYGIDRDRANELMQHLVVKGFATVFKSTDTRTTYELIQNPYA